MKIHLLFRKLIISAIFAASYWSGIFQADADPCYIIPYTGDQYVDQNTVYPDMGTPTNPYREFQDAVKDITSGGTLWIAPGRYTGTGIYKTPMTVCNSKPGEGVVELEGEPVSLERIRALAPIVYLHDDEGYFPDDATNYARASRFRQHIAGDYDYGYNKNTGQWNESNSHESKYYDIPLDFINGYKLYEHKLNKRPHDDNSKGNECEVFLQPDDNRTGHSHPTGNAPTYYRVIRRHSEGLILIQYWFFFGYNEHFNSHQGDWEGLTVGLNDKDGKETFYSLNAHGDPDRISDLSKLQHENGRVVVYSANGSHATYREENNPTICVYCDKRSKGYRWDTSQKLLKLNDQPWRDFAGAWGEVGDGVAGIEASEFTGPLGPWEKDISY